MDSNSSSLNGFSINKFSRQLYLNSKYANYTVDTGRNSSCSFVLNEPINIPKGMNAYCSVVSAEIPNTIFSVDQYTNIPIIVTKTGTGLVSSLTVQGVSSATNYILLQSGNTSSLVVGMPVMFPVTMGSIVGGTTYYVQSIASTTQFTISTTYGGGVMTQTAGSGFGYPLFYGIINNSLTFTAVDVQTTQPSNFTVSGLTGLKVGTQIFNISAWTGNALLANTSYYVYSINTANSTVQLSTSASLSSFVSATTGGTGTFTFYSSATSVSQTFNITGSTTVNGIPGNLTLTAGNYSSSIYNTTNPTSLASQFSKVLGFTADTVAGTDNITLVCYYGVPQTKFFLGFIPTKGVYSISINAPVFGFTSPGNNQPQVFNQLTSAIPTTLNVNFTLATQTYSGLTIANNIPRFFPPYIVIGTNLHANNQAVGETKINTLAKVIVDVPYNAFIFFRNAYAYSNWISNRELFTIELYLYDETGALINMQGAPWSITLQIDYD